MLKYLILGTDYCGCHFGEHLPIVPIENVVQESSRLDNIERGEKSLELFVVLGFPGYCRYLIAGV
jgi:hypothetical protein